MNKKQLTSKYNSPLRESQALQTRTKICLAGIGLFEKSGGTSELTYKAIAKEAGVTEMTVFRHFPTREVLLEALWNHASENMGVQFPSSIEEALKLNDDLFHAFESNGNLLRAGIMSEQGREIEKNLNKHKSEAYLKIVEQIDRTLPPRRKRQIAALLSHLQSPMTWDALSTYWGMKPSEIADTVKFAINAIQSNRKK